MGIRKQRKIMNENREGGFDSEKTRYAKDYIIHNLNPFSDSYVERHDNPNDPYDAKFITEKNGRKRTVYKEYKSGNATQSPQEKQFQEDHPRSYEIERTGSGSFVNDLRRAKRFLVD